MTVEDPGGRSTVEERLVELEARAELQGKTVEDLDDVVREFTRRVEALERELRELRAVLSAAASGGPGSGEPYGPS